MSQLTSQIGERLRSLRLSAGLTQEGLAERADLHTTYIGQLERGEKNATIETVCKLADALNVPAARLFAHLPGPAGQPSPAEEIYQLVQECPPREQQALLVLLRQLLQYKRL